ncbi:hypothetical protein B0H66DRAFT_530059 [Apodospora peruviana]|uniref:Uncharacterized protein n=1 Tax=Apodospora peruviana TaxID=516989 RepID=A0AAE0IIZ4_9PEZI|nr:hypothetical protein B0H66DRAFT_530059 [Apodospora peruviana]
MAEDSIMTEPPTIAPEDRSISLETVILQLGRIQSTLDDMWEKIMGFMLPAQVMAGMGFQATGNRPQAQDPAYVSSQHYYRVFSYGIRVFSRLTQGVKQYPPVPARGTGSRNSSSLSWIRERDALDNEKNALGADNSDLRRRLDGAVAKLQRTEGQLRGAQDEIQKIRKESAVFRNIIMDQATTQKVSDYEVVQGFRDLYQSIQKLARSPSYALNDREAPDLAPHHQERADMVDFYGMAGWGGLSAKDRGLRMRAEFFRILYDRILANNCFGLDGFEKDKVAGHIAGLGTVEPGLQRFERLLKEKHISDSVIDSWRIATINCVEKCQVEEETSKATAREIFVFFEPLLSSRAFGLKITMRNSREGYACGLTEQEDCIRQRILLSAHESWVEAVAVEAGKDNEAGDEIAYALFGALFKLQGGKPAKVLEKAHVVLRKK